MSSASIKSSRATVKLFLTFVASKCQRTITGLGTEDPIAERVREFLSPSRDRAQQPHPHM
jgi:hypothetical protein